MAADTEAGNERGVAQPMGWETRKGRSYYYQKVREGDCVRSLYVGGGHLAQCAAVLDRQARAGQQSQRREFERDRAKLDALDEASAEFRDAANALLRAALLRGGYREHKGEWRRSRASKAAEGRAPEDANA
jgi:hypothetical protein